MIGGFPQMNIGFPGGSLGGFQPTPTNTFGFPNQGFNQGFGAPPQNGINFGFGGMGQPGGGGINNFGLGGGLFPVSQGFATPFGMSGSPINGFSSNPLFPPGVMGATFPNPFAGALSFLPASVYNYPNALLGMLGIPGVNLEPPGNFPTQLFPGIFS